MTGNHTGVSPHNSFYHLIKDLPLDKNSLHDIRLWFKVPGIWSLLSTNSSYRINPRSKDIRMPGINENDLFIGVTIHSPDTVTVIIRFLQADCRGCQRNHTSFKCTNHSKGKVINVDRGDRPCHWSS